MTCHTCMKLLCDSYSYWDASAPEQKQSFTTNPIVSINHPIKVIPHSPRPRAYKTKTHKIFFRISQNIPRGQSSSPKSWPRASPDSKPFLGTCRVCVPMHPELILSGILWTWLGEGICLELHVLSYDSRGTAERIVDADKDLTFLNFQSTTSKTTSSECLAVRYILRNHFKVILFGYSLWFCEMDLKYHSVSNAYHGI